MKKWLIGGVAILVTSIFAIGNMNWNQQVEKTVKEAEVVLREKQEKGDANIIEKNTEELAEEKTDSAVVDEPVDNNKKSNVSTETQTQTQTAPKETPQTSSEVTNGDQNSSDKTPGDNQQAESEKEEEIVLEKLSIGQIKDKYFLQFRELEKTQNQKLDELLLEAYNEHEYYKANNITFSKDEFVDKYRTIAAQLEAEADTAFYKTYENMKKELSYNEFSEAEAEPYLNYYETSKERRRSSMLSIAN